MPTSSGALTRARILLLVAAWAGVAGCGGGPRMPRTHPLKGKVVFKGGGPVTGGSISFESTAGEPPWRAGAQIEQDGTFSEVSTLGPDGKEVKGIVEGEHRVRIDLGRGDAGEDAPRVRVPQRYLNYQTSGLTVRIPAPDNEATITLEDR